MIQAVNSFSSTVQQNMQFHKKLCKKQVFFLLSYIEPNLDKEIM